MLYLYCGVFAQGKNCEASRDCRYFVTASQRKMFPRQQSETAIEE
jgi:hypothetical protein